MDITVRHLIIFVLLLACVTPEAQAADTDGRAYIRDEPNCQQYLDAYARAKLLDGGGIVGPVATAHIFGWVIGYISGFNSIADIDETDIAHGLSSNDIHRWLASWCRDNPTEDTSDAINHLYWSRM